MTGWSACTSRPQRKVREDESPKEHRGSPKKEDPKRDDRKTKKGDD